MITFLPKLYPGELLYSWFARYHIQSGNTSFKQTNLELFGSASHIATPDLPCKLYDLFKRSQYFSPPKPETWIRNHTFYNYYSAFTPFHLKKKLMESMLNGSHHALHMQIGHMASTVNDIQFFRYCPSCMKKDILSYGEPYLHTIHQLPSCFICPKHDEILRESSIPFRGFNKHEYKPLLNSYCTEKAVVDGIENKTLNVLSTIAKESKFLIEGAFHFDPVKIQKKYKYILNEHGLLSPKGNVRQQLFSESFLHFFNKETLKILQSCINLESESNWLKSITRKHRKAFHPIRHLLLMNFLGLSINNFSKVKQTQFPFGKGPFPCLNKAAAHYKKEVIQNVTISYCSKTKNPIGTFACKCGFVYTRRGAGPELHNKFQIGRVKNFGHVWLNKLEELLNQKKYSFRAISRQLNVDPNTVIKYSKLERKPTNKTINSRPLPTQNYRNIWISLQERYPLYSKTGLRKLQPNVYIWLYRNDKQWLNKHSPNRSQKKICKPKVDWGKRDANLSNELLPIVINLLNHSKPTRVTKSKLGKLMRKQSLLEKHIDKLPITKFVIDEVTESTDEFQARRAVWAYMKLKVNHEDICLWKIKKIARLPNKIELQTRLYNTLERLKVVK